MGLIEFFLAPVAASVLLPVGVLLVQIVCAQPAPRWSRLPPFSRPRVAVLVPAHNEATVIAGTIASLKPQLRQGDRLLVVADNCSDETAAVARRAGAEVVERRDEMLCGKGYALDCGIRQLGRDPPPVLVIVDADCAVHPGSIDWLACRCAETGRPVQALDLMKAPPGSGLATRIAEFAWIVKNQARPLGYHRLGLPCHLLGTGMAFPWHCIGAAPVASGHIVEDMKLGLDLARAGAPASFCPEAQVTSFFPTQRQAVASQRRRWEHGHLGVIINDAPALLRDGLRRRNRALVALALDLCVPPLALLFLLVAILVGASGLIVLLGASSLTLVIALTAAAGLLLAVSLAWWRFGRGVLSPFQLLAAAFYALWKIPLYLSFFLKRQTRWVRTRREAE